MLHANCNRAQLNNSNSQLMLIKLSPRVKSMSMINPGLNRPRCGNTYRFSNAHNVIGFICTLKHAVGMIILS